MKNTPTALQGALAFDILTRLVKAMTWDNSQGDTEIHLENAAIINEAFALCGDQPMCVDPKYLGDMETIYGFPRDTGSFDPMNSNDHYAERVEAGLREQFHALRKRIAEDRLAQESPKLAEVYVNVETTVPRSRLNCEDLQIAGTYKVMVPGDFEAAKQAAIALAVFHDKVGLKDPAHFNLQVIQVMEADPAYSQQVLSSLGEYKGAFSFHPSLEPVARKA
jgi:hypothetical protein